MYIDLISYELASNVTEEQLLKVTEKIHTEWMKDVEGFRDWKICKTEEGKYCDIVTWEDKKFADAAEKQMGQLPNLGEWIACYKEGSISNKRINQIDHLQK